MITVADIFVKYGDRVLLNRINLVIGEKDKIGLVGRNGAGKSTLFKIIAKELRPDEGRISFPKNASLAYLKQEMNLPKGKTIMQEALSAFEEAKILEAKIEEYNKQVHQRTDYESESYYKLLEDLSTASDRFEILGGHHMEANAERILKGLGFKQSDMNRLTDEFSGGWKMRVELAKMLLRKPEFLLLDEPTNHLDIESIIWLEQFLKNYYGAVLLISHDRQFLDAVTKRTVEIELGKIYDYKAPYSKYLAQRAERKMMQEAAYKNQQKSIAQRERTINRFMAKATKTKMAQSMKKQLDKLERIEIDEGDNSTMNLGFPPAPRSGQVVAEVIDVSKNYGDLNVLNNISLKLDRADRVSFVGQNGQGKTTLAKMIINLIPATTGQIKHGHNVQIGYYAQDQSDLLDPKLTLLETMENASPPEMRTRLRNVLGAFLFSGEDVDKKVSVLSGGERARLALACMLLRPFNLLVLDEPTNHLDILSKDVLKKALLQYDGTLIVVSHDRDFLKGLTNRTIEFRDKHLFEYIGDINAFLEKRALQNMREVEMASNNNKTNTSKKSKLSFQDRKKLTRAVANAEKKIERLEKKIQDYDLKMAEPEFYQQANYQQEIDALKKIKKELEIAYQEWEIAHSELDKHQG